VEKKRITELEEIAEKFKLPLKKLGKDLEREKNILSDEL